MGVRTQCGPAEYLLKHIRLNRLRNVNLIQAAVSNKNGITGFQTTGCQCHGAYHRHGSSRGFPTVSLDGLIAENAIPVPDVIKMDDGGRWSPWCLMAPEPCSTGIRQYCSLRCMAKIRSIAALISCFPDLPHFFFWTGPSSETRPCISTRYTPCPGLALPVRS